ncbi:MAG: HEAT repeat domain-containing protein, partial [Chitinophagaceae bacterium]
MIHTTLHTLLFFSEYPIIIQIAAMLSLTGLALICLTMFLIFFNRIKTVRLQKNQGKAEKIIYEELSNHFLIYNSVEEIPKEELEHTIRRLSTFKNKNRVFSQALIKTLVYFKLNLSGTTTEMINSAYVWLGLRAFVVKKSKSWQWFVRNEGLMEMQEMNDTSSLPAIEKITTDLNIDVRITAYAALIKLKSPNSFSFLDKESEQLTVWHQIFLLDAISKVPDIQLPNFTSCLASANKSIILFCLKVIVYYKCFYTIPKMIELLAHDDDDVRNQIIWALGMLNAEDAENKLTESYPKENLTNKSQILLALGNIASGQSLNFIVAQFLDSQNHLLLKSAAQAITLHEAE